MKNFVLLVVAISCTACTDVYVPVKITERAKTLCDNFGGMRHALFSKYNDDNWKVTSYCDRGISVTLKTWEEKNND